MELEVRGDIFNVCVCVYLCFSAVVYTVYLKV